MNDTSEIEPVVPSVRVKLPVAVTVLPTSFWLVALDATRSDAIPASASYISSPASTVPFWLASCQISSCA